MSKHAVSPKLYICFAVLMSMPVLFAADNSGGQPAPAAPSANTAQQNSGRRHFDSRINTWAEGTVSSIDYDHNTFIVHGKTMPFASAHAQMRKEFHDKMKNADPSQREKIASDVRQEWNSRLDTARKQMANEPEKDFNLKFAADGKVKNASEFPLFTALHERRELLREMQQKAGVAGEKPELIGEFVIVDVYEVPQNVSYEKGQAQSQNTSGESAAEEQKETAAQEAAEHPAKLSFRDVKAGDKVMCGFDNTSDSCFLVIRENKTSSATSTSTSQPEKQSR